MTSCFIYGRKETVNEVITLPCLLESHAVEHSEYRLLERSLHAVTVDNPYDTPVEV